MKNARAKRAEILFSIVKYANFWGFCCRRRRGCFRLPNNNTTKTKSDGIGCCTCGEKIFLKKLHVRVIQILHLIIDFVIPDNGTKIRLDITNS